MLDRQTDHAHIIETDSKRYRVHIFLRKQTKGLIPSTLGSASAAHLGPKK